MSKKAEYLQVVHAINDLKLVTSETHLTRRAVEYLEERKIKLSPIYIKRKP